MDDRKGHGKDVYKRQVVHRMVEEVMIRAGGNIGFDVTPTTKVKTA